MTQGALYALATAACRENARAGVRYNELYLVLRVEVDADAARHGVTRSSEFALPYVAILSRPEIRGCRVSVVTREDLTDIKYKPKLE